MRLVMAHLQAHQIQLPQRQAQQITMLMFSSLRAAAVVLIHMAVAAVVAGCAISPG
jgi:hypothetical protein